MDIQEIIERTLNLYNLTIRQYVFQESTNFDMFIHKTYLEVWKALIEHYNKTYGSSRRKPLDAVIKEAAERGFTITRSSEECGLCLLKKNGVEFKYFKDGNYRYLVYTSFPISSLYISGFRVKLEAEPLFDCMEEFLSCFTAVRDSLNRRIIWCKQENNVDQISFPTICDNAERTLSKRDIKYYLERSQSGTVIYANIIKDLWFYGPIDIATMDRVLSLVPYALKRPDCIKRDIGHRFGTLSDYTGKYEKAWKQYQDTIGKRLRKETAGD